MGEEADFLIDRMLFPPSPPTSYEWKHEGDSRMRQHGANLVIEAKMPPHVRNCKCSRCVRAGIRKIEEQYNAERLSVERAFKQIDPYDVPTNIVCKRCQTTGLHWGLKDGKPEMREEGGWPHKCKKIEGITLNLPNILNPQ